MRIELENFYPYGPQNGDSAVPRNDDGNSGRVNIGFPFPFFDSDQNSLYVSSYLQNERDKLMERLSCARYTFLLYDDTVIRGENNY